WVRALALLREFNVAPIRTLSLKANWTAAEPPRGMRDPPVRGGDVPWVREFSLQRRLDVAELAGARALPPADGDSAPRWVRDCADGFAEYVGLWFPGATDDDMDGAPAFTLGPQSLMAVVQSCAGAKVREFYLKIGEAVIPGRRSRRLIYE